MTGRNRKQLLVGYSLLAVAGIVAYGLFRHRLLTLMPAMPVPGQQPSWSQLTGIATFTLFFAGTVFFSTPTNPLFYLAAGYLYGAVGGTVISVVATTLGSGAAYLFFKSTITPPQSPSFQEMEPAKMFLVLVLLRSSPWFPSPIINAFCGAVRVRPSLFLLSSVFGSVPLVSVYTFVASKMRGHMDISLLRSPEIRTALFIMGALSLIGLLKPLRLAASNIRTLVRR